MIGGLFLFFHHAYIKQVCTFLHHNSLDESYANLGSSRYKLYFLIARLFISGFGDTSGIQDIFNDKD